MKRLPEKRGIKIAAVILLTAAVLGAVFAVWRANPIRDGLFSSDTISYVKGKVISVNDENIEESPDLPGRSVGVQNVTVEITSGDLKGERVTFDNYLSTTHSVEVREGTRVVLKCDCPEGVEPYYSIYQYDRTLGIVAAFAVFVIMTAAVGRTKGLRAAFALAVSVIVIAFALIPAVYNGAPPVPVTLVCCMVITAFTLILLNGAAEKTAVAMLATYVGLALSVAFYFIVSAMLRANGYALEETESLIMISRATGLHISDVMFCGVLLASLGAAMDTTMSISSSLFEITAVSPSIGKKGLFRSGMNIGGDMIGTMCQTLILAFVGTSVASLLVAVSYGTRIEQFISSDFLACEIIQGLTGSFAVILAVPVTSLLCAVFTGAKKAKN